MQEFLKRFQNGEFAESAKNFKGLSGLSISKLSKADFLRRSSEMGDVLFDAVRFGRKECCIVRFVVRGSPFFSPFRLFLSFAFLFFFCLRSDSSKPYTPPSRLLQEWTKAEVEEFIGRFQNGKFSKHFDKFKATDGSTLAAKTLAGFEKDVGSDAPELFSTLLKFRWGTDQKKKTAKILLLLPFASPSNLFCLFVFFFRLC